MYDFANLRWTPATMEDGPADWSIGESYSLAGLPSAPETPISTGPTEALVQGVFLDYPLVRATFNADTRQVLAWDPIPAA